MSALGAVGILGLMEGQLAEWLPRVGDDQPPPQNQKYIRKWWGGIEESSRLEIQSPSLESCRPLVFCMHTCCEENDKENKSHSRRRSNFKVQEIMHVHPLRSHESHDFGSLMTKRQALLEDQLRINSLYFYSSEHCNGRLDASALSHCLYLICPV